MIAAPTDVKLPFFAYGAFKPGELAHAQIVEFLSSEQGTIATTVPGELLVRDGLPLFKPDCDGHVRGCLLSFRPDSANEAYDRICKFEPSSIYFWTTVTVREGKANILQGKKLDKGNASLLESREWTFRLDPVFEHGLKVVQQITSELTCNKFTSAPPESFDWSRFFRIQAAYLLLWSAIERFSAFAYGPSLKSEERIEKLDKDPRFRAAFKRHAMGTKKVFDSRNPKNSIKVDPTTIDADNPTCPCKAAEFYYGVRSNLSHRGKGACVDGELVRISLIELLAIINDILKPESEVSPCR